MLGGVYVRESLYFYFKWLPESCQMQILKCLWKYWDFQELSHQSDS
jgi:hypothetical protein